MLASLYSLINICIVHVTKQWIIKNHSFVDYIVMALCKINAQYVFFVVVVCLFVFCFVFVFYKRRVSTSV